MLSPGLEYEVSFPWCINTFQDAPHSVRKYKICLKSWIAFGEAITVRDFVSFLTLYPMRC